MKFDTRDKYPIPKTVVEREKKKRENDITFKAIALDKDEPNKVHVTYSDDSEISYNV